MRPRARRMMTVPALQRGAARHRKRLALRVRSLKMSLAGQDVASSFSFGADRLLSALQHLALGLN